MTLANSRRVDSACGNTNAFRQSFGKATPRIVSPSDQASPKHTHIHTRTHTYTHTQAKSLSHTLTHTHTQAHTHTHTILTIARTHSEVTNEYRRPISVKLQLTDLTSSGAKRSIHSHHEFYRLHGIGPNFTKVQTNTE